MSELNEQQLERLISRKLDGELTEAEALEFDRELLRNPQARALYERDAQLDQLAGDVLRDCAAPQPQRIAANSAPVATVPRRSRLNDGMMLASALAACLAIVVLIRTPAASNDPASPPPTIASNNQPPYATPTVSQLASRPHEIPKVGIPRTNNTAMDGGVWQVGHQTAPRVDRTTDRNLILLTDDDGNLYWLNVDHIREIEQPNNSKPNQWASNPI